MASAQLAGSPTAATRAASSPPAAARAALRCLTLESVWRLLLAARVAGGNSAQPLSSSTAAPQQVVLSYCRMCLLGEQNRTTQTMLQTPCAGTKAFDSAMAVAA